MVGNGPNMAGKDKQRDYRAKRDLRRGGEPAAAIQPASVRSGRTNEDLATEQQTMNKEREGT
jgi:hypothetical protein